MNSSDLRRLLDNKYQQLREDNRSERDRRIDELSRLDNEIAGLLKKNSELLSRNIHAILINHGAAASMKEQTLQEAAKLNQQLQSKLKALGYPENYLDPIYSCPKCKDRGYIGEAVREMCTCYKQQMIQLRFDNHSIASEQTFDSFNEHIFDSKRIVNDDNQTQLTNAMAARSDCLDYADSYPDSDSKGVLITGKVGLGKTFLINCMANRLIERGFSPITVTAYKLFDILKNAEFGNEDKIAERDELLNCDVLFIDDLGTEPFMKNLTNESLFMLLNERTVNRKHTSVATNLSLSELSDRYADRIFSRLIKGKTLVELAGTDLRRNPKTND